MTGHHTWCGVIFNFQPTPWNVYNPQDDTPLGIPGKPAGVVQPTSNSFGCMETLGWCSNGNEIRTKAFRFRKGSTGREVGVITFYLFLDYPTESVMFTRGPAGIYETRIGTNTNRARCCNVLLLPGIDDPRINVIAFDP